MAGYSSYFNGASGPIFNFRLICLERLERVTYRQVKYDILLSPAFIPKVNPVKDPSLTFRQMRDPYWKCNIKTQNKKLKVQPNSGTGSNCHLLKEIPRYFRSGFQWILIHKPHISRIYNN